MDGVAPSRLLERALNEPAIATVAETRPMHVVAAGKAAAAMAAEFMRLSRADLRSVTAAGTHPPRDGNPAIEWHLAGHPLPDQGSARAGARVLDIARNVRAGEALVLLLSGGASALLAAPAEGLTIDDKREATGLLQAAGADIVELNTVRKHLSAIKGGRLAATATGPTLTLAISDVVGDDLGVIGSGPTVADPTSFRDATAVIDRLSLRDRMPPAVIDLLARGERGESPETPKPADARLARSVAHVIGNRFDALDGARKAAEACGYQVTVLTDPIVGEARAAGAEHAAIARRARRSGQPTCLLSSGETVVRVVGRGRGGRNLEFALAFVSSFGDGEFTAASVGTDGIDGATDAAGAIVDRTTMRRAAEAGLRPPEFYLTNNDSYAFFAALGDLIMTGPTDTNVGDLQVVLMAG